MKSVFRVVVTAALCLGAATLAAAATQFDVLNKLEVQKFVAADTRIANLSLAAHFNGLAEQFFDEASHYRDLAVASRANANRSAATTAADTYTRLAARAATWAVRARALAQYHMELGSGRAAILPLGATVLQSGYGAPEPSNEDLHKLALTARTRADHFALREYYSTLARRKAAEADSYRIAATGARAGVRKGHYDPGFAFEHLARIARKAAREASLAAERHQVFANIG